MIPGWMWKGDSFSTLLVRDHVDPIAEVELAVALGAPAGVDAIHVAAAHPEDRDGADHLDPPGIDDALHLDDFVRAPPDEHVESRLAGLGERGGRVQPVAERAGAVATEVDARQRHAALPEQVERLQQKLVVEDLRDRAAERAVALAVAEGVQHVVQLDRAADEHVALAGDEGFAGIELQLQAALHLVVELFGVQQQFRARAGRGRSVRIGEGVRILQHARAPSGRTATS